MFRLLVPVNSNNYEINVNIVGLLIALLVVIVIFLLIVPIFIYKYKNLNNELKEKNSIIEKYSDDNSEIFKDNQLTKNEINLLTEYRKLNSHGKELVNNTINTLNLKTDSK